MLIIRVALRAITASAYVLALSDNVAPIVEIHGGPRPMKMITSNTLWHYDKRMRLG